MSVPVPAKSTKVAAIFNGESDDDEPEEMPAECRMRMKNVGRYDDSICIIKNYILLLFACNRLLILFFT